MYKGAEGGKRSLSNYYHRRKSELYKKTVNDKLIVLVSLCDFLFLITKETSAAGPQQLTSNLIKMYILNNEKSKQQASSSGKRNHR